MMFSFPKNQKTYKKYSYQKSSRSGLFLKIKVSLFWRVEIKKEKNLNLTEETIPHH